MEFFNEKVRKALDTGIYICPECSAQMQMIEGGDTLWCPKCNFTQDYDKYGFTDEEYEALYPTLEEVLEMEGETYNEVYSAPKKK